MRDIEEAKEMEEEGRGGKEMERGSEWKRREKGTVIEEGERQWREERYLEVKGK